MDVLLQIHAEPTFFPPENLIFGIFGLFTGGKKWPGRPVVRFSLEVVDSVPEFVFVAKFVKKHLKICRYILTRVPLAFRLFKPIVNDDNHPEESSKIMENIKNFDQESLYLTFHYGMKRRRLFCVN